MNVHVKSEAAKALAAIRPQGPLKVASIDPENESAAPVVRCFVMPDQRADLERWIARNDGKCNLYFEPNPPHDATPKKSRKVDIARVCYLHTDMDPEAGEKPPEAQARHLAALESGAVPKPTFAWPTGNGTQALWSVEGGVEVRDAEAAGAGIAMELGGDSTFNIDRLLRIPFTVNLPNAKKRAGGRVPVRAGGFVIKNGTTHALDTFPRGKPSVSAPDLYIGPAETVDDLDALNIEDTAKRIIREGAEKGKRSDAVFHVVAAMLRANVPLEQMVGILTDPQFEISARALEKGGDDRERAEDFARRDVARCVTRVKAERDADLTSLAEVEDEMSVEDAFREGEEGDSEPKAKPDLKFDIAPYQPKDPTTIPKRDWLYMPAYIRKFVGLTTATGGAGKSSLILVEAVAMACGKDLLGIEPVAKLRVFYWNGEDPQEELVRRLEAILKHYGLTKADLGDRLFIKSGRDMRIKIAETDRSGTKIAKPMVRAMVRAIREHKLDVVVIDPFVSSHTVPENDNGAIEQVAKMWADIADKTNCAVHLSHHTRKSNGFESTIEDSRGASALNYAARTRRAVNVMTAAEATAAGIGGERAHLSYFKTDMANSSMTRPAETKDWYRFESVDLMNGGRDEMGMPLPGDSVGVVVRWEYQKLALDLSEEGTGEVLKALEEGRWRKNPTSDDWAGHAIAKAVGANGNDKAVKAQIKTLIDEWLKDGVLEEYTGQDKKRNERQYVRPAMDFG